MTASVVLFTRDLRLADNPALAAAVRAPAVVPLFVLDEAILRRTREQAGRLAFLLDSLRDLDAGLRAGAAHFLRHLVDADVACNQLNWQWVAGTGTDANRHRVFSPAVQARRFDPTGVYIRRYVPELAGLPAAAVHAPDPATRRACGYPEPILDHREAIAAYRARAR
jgi:deoxyribodipyrimidine photo-lyase